MKRPIRSFVANVIAAIAILQLIPHPSWGGCSAVSSESPLLCADDDKVLPQQLRSTTIVVGGQTAVLYPDGTETLTAIGNANTLYAGPGIAFAIGTSTSLVTSTATATSTATGSGTATASSGNSYSGTWATTSTGESTATAAGPGNTYTHTGTYTSTSTVTGSRTVTTTSSFTGTGTGTVTVTHTGVETYTATGNFVVTQTVTTTGTASVTGTSGATAVGSYTKTQTESATGTTALTQTYSFTGVSTATGTGTGTGSRTVAMTVTNTGTGTASRTSMTANPITVTNTATASATYGYNPIPVYATVSLTGTSTGTATGTVTDSTTITGTQTATSVAVASDPTIISTIGESSLAGSGTANYYTRWADTSTLETGMISDNGTEVAIHGDLACGPAHIVGDSDVTGSFQVIGDVSASNITPTPGIGKIPQADAAGKLDGWVTNRLQGIFSVTNADSVVTDSGGAWTDVATTTTIINGGQLLIWSAVRLSPSTATCCYARLVVDSTQIGAELAFCTSTIGSLSPVGYASSLTATTHAIKIQARSTSSTTCTVSAGTSALTALHMPI